MTFLTVVLFASVSLRPPFRVAGQKQEEKKDEAKDAAAAASNGASNPLAALAGLTGAGGAGAGAVAGAAKDKGKDKEEGVSFAQLHQAVAVLGVAMVTTGEELGAQMALRFSPLLLHRLSASASSMLPSRSYPFFSLFPLSNTGCTCASGLVYRRSLDHVVQYGDINVRRSIPLALALLSVSNPRLSVVDTLSKLSHDSDLEISQNAVLCLGIVGAGRLLQRVRCVCVCVCMCACVYMCVCVCCCRQ